MAKFEYIDDLVVCRAAKAGAAKCAGEPKEKREGQFDFYIHRPYKYRYEDQDEVVPQGESTDFASVPWIARTVISKIGYHTEGAVVHDHLYRKEVEGDPSEAKAYADNVFRAAMDSHEMPRWKAWLAYAAVSAFGHGAFNAHRERKARLQLHQLGNGLALALVGSVLALGVGLLIVVLAALAPLAAPIWLVLAYLSGKVLG